MKVKVKLIVLLWICLSLCWVTSARECTNFFGWEDLIWSWLVNSDYTIVSLIKTFCTQAADMSCQQGDYYFDASQSLFMSLLCNNIWEWQRYISWDLYAWSGAILKKHTFLSFDIYSCAAWVDGYCPEQGWDMCNYKQTKDMNWCDLSYFLPKIFDPLMNDFFNIKQAGNLWISELTDTFDKEKFVNQYMNENFPGLSVQNWMEEWFCKSKYYKESCKYVKNYMTQLNNLLKNTKIIDVKNLSSKKVDCANNFTWNILYCWLLWDQKTPMVSFLKVVYNEYYWYNLFMSYYTYKLAYDYRYSEEWNSKAANYTQAIASNNQKIYAAKENLARSKEAMTTALRSLSEITYTFPIHVWFLMYQEDIIYFIKNMPKVYTPIRTLYDKLRNVQDADS